MASPALVYGPIIGVQDIDRAIINLLKEWMQSYLNEIARQSGESFSRLVKPRSYRAGSEVEFLPEDQRPCCVVVCGGLVESSIYSTSGPQNVGRRIQATWNYEIAFQVVAQGKKSVDSIHRAHELVMTYVTAARVVLEQQKPEVDMIVDLINEAPGDMDPEADRNSAVGVLTVQVTVPTTHMKGIGPDTPEVDPPEDSPIYPEVQPDQTYLEITKETYGGEN